MMIEKIISGGQTGADQAGWRSARKAGIPTSGWMPRGFKTEDGPRPEFADLYNAREMTTSNYPDRTKRNVAESHCTLWFGSGDSMGFGCTVKACKAASKPMCLIQRPDDKIPSVVMTFIKIYNHHIINIAGNRESITPGIGKWTEEFLDEMFSTIRIKI